MLAALAVLLLAAAPGPVDATAGKRAEALRAERAPAINGDLSDPVWQRARFVSDLRQREPVEGAPPSRRTEVAFAFDDEALYVGARMFTRGPDDVQAPMTRRDDTGTAERLIVSFDTFLDRRTATSFAVTAAGVRADWLHPDDSAGNRDHSYDPVWEAAVRHGTDRWTAEMRIPFTQLRFPDRTSQRWGLNINRFIPDENEDLFWVVVPKAETGWASYFGELVGIEELPSPRRVEVVPYVASELTATSRQLIDPDDPFADRLDASIRAGVDLELGLGPNLTLDATIHPDFGQVEADPAVVNLSAFEIRFDERRPFFIEGRRHLAGNGPSYFYSRRIGGRPRAAAEGDFVDVPSSTPILGAVKLTGRLPSRLSLGALSALTASTDARTFDVTTGEQRLVTVEPLTSYNVLRLEQEMGANASRIGATATGVLRDLDGALASQMPRYATTGGADWNLRFDGGRYELAGNAGYSAVGGDEAAIERLQTSSTHFYQRPDQDHVEVDPTRDVLAGWTGALWGGKRSGNWRWFAGSWAESPGFDLNDAGILQSTDDLGGELGLSYRSTEPGPIAHNWTAETGVFQEWNFGGARRPGRLWLGGNITLGNFWNAWVNGSLGTPGLDDTRTRGGPLMGIGWAGETSAGLQNAFSARTQWNLGASWAVAETGASGISAWSGITMRPLDRLQLSLSPRAVRITDERQYVTTIEDAMATRTFGARYVFGTLRRRELAVQARAQLAFTPDLSLEIYAEPFVSSGAYISFGELAAPASEDLRRYGAGGTRIEQQDGRYLVTDGAASFEIPDPDFTITSLRSTAVLRWEFLPGSTLFLVWQQNRSDFAPRADGASPGDLGQSIASPGTHTFAVKATYWWGG